MATINDFSGHTPTWCPGCGNWGIGVAVKQVLVKQNLTPSSLMVVFGIGCSGNMNDFLNAYAMHALHGRAVSTAVGIKLARHDMPVLVIAGDGDCYGEGGNHFLHACRGNHDITVIVHDNCVYGLTTGQAAPTSLTGYRSKSTPFGVLETPINPLTLAITQGATFVAQAFAGDMKGMTELIQKGMDHKGFSLINILQPCVTFNKAQTFQYYLKKKFVIPDTHDTSNKNDAVKIASLQLEEQYPVGILYQEKRRSYHEGVTQLPHGSSLVKREQIRLPEILESFR